MDKELIQNNAEAALKEIWEQRRPFHMMNMDTGRDMFWGTVLMVLQDFAQTEAGAEWMSDKSVQPCCANSCDGFKCEDGTVQSLKKQELRNRFFQEHTINAALIGHPKVSTAPHDLFEWFWNQFAAEVETLKSALHRDQTGLATSLAEVKKTVDGYRWVAEGRGPYAWDDDRYKAEMLTMLELIGGIAYKGLAESGVRSHAYCCERGKTYEQLQEELKERDLIIYGLEEGAGEWQLKCSDLQRDVEELKAWKQSAIDHIPDYQAIGEALELTISESVSDKILPGIQQLKKDRYELLIQLRRLQAYCSRFLRKYEQTPRYQEVEDTLSKFHHTVNPS